MLGGKCLWNFEGIPTSELQPDVVPKRPIAMHVLHKRLK